MDQVLNNSQNKWFINMIKKKIRDINFMFSTSLYIHILKMVINRYNLIKGKEKFIIHLKT